MGVKADADAEMTPRARISSVPYALSMDKTFLANFMGDFTSNPDYDGDGYLKTGAYADCNDWKSAIHHGASELCYDGIDNDCDGIVDANDPDCWATPPGMALIPAGCFNMGDAFSEGDGNELPVHNVCITSSFYMDVHEVTNAEYAACVSVGELPGAQGMSFPGRDPGGGHREHPGRHPRVAGSRGSRGRGLHSHRGNGQRLTMPKIPGINPEQAVRALERTGFRVLRQGKHIIMSDGVVRLTIPRHNPLNAYTMGAIARDAA